MMRRGTSLDADQAWREFLKKRQDIAALQLTTDDDLALRINTVDLEYRLGDIETDSRDRLHVGLLQIVGALTAPTFMALTCRWRSRPQHQKPTFRHSRDFRLSPDNGYLARLQRYYKHSRRLGPCR